MTTYRLMDGLSGRPGNGPAGPTAFAGAFEAGTAFQLTSPGLWMTGFWWWVPTGGDTGAQQFQLYQIDNVQAGLTVAGTAVTSGTLTVNSWNFVPLSSPIPLTHDVPYMVSTGWTAVNGFPETINQFGSTQPFAAGITNGPLQAFSDTTGSLPVPNSWSSQGAFGTAAWPHIPNQGDRSANFWVDVQVTDAPPAGTSYRLWPSLPDPPNRVADTAQNFTLGTEFKLSQLCTLNKLWFYSPSGTTQLPTELGIWNVSGTSLIAATHQTSPTWSGAAGSGWVSASFSSVQLAAGSYKATVLNAAGTPVIWNSATNNYWSSGGGASGITNGPLSAPSEATADSPGQGSYHQSAVFTYPDTYSTGNAPSYWVDVEVTPVVVAAGSALLVASIV